MKMMMMMMMQVIMAKLGQLLHNTSLDYLVSVIIWMGNIVNNLVYSDTVRSVRNNLYSLLATFYNKVTIPFPVSHSTSGSITSTRTSSGRSQQPRRPWECSSGSCYQGLRPTSSTPQVVSCRSSWPGARVPNTTASLTEQEMARVREYWRRRAKSWRTQRTTPK